jgi:hypothetical protein
MNIYFFVLICLAFSPVVHAQGDTSAPVYGWKHTLVSGLTLTQIAYTDWAQGGDNALAYAMGIEGKAVSEELRTNWATSYKFAFGQARLGGKGLRKTEDKIDLESVLTYKLGTNINPYTAATFKSQFTEGFKYDDTSRVRVSHFLDPAYMTQSVGVGYQPVIEFKTRLGLALRETFADRFAAVYSDDPSTPEIETVKIEGGLESVSELESKFAEDMLLKSKLELFAPFKALDVIVVRMDNTLVASVNEFINVQLNVQLINERSITPRTQIKETLALGITYTLL